MTRRDTFEASAHSSGPAERSQDAPTRLTLVSARILEYLIFAGLIGVGILLAGLAARFLFGSSVTTIL